MQPNYGGNKRKKEAARKQKQEEKRKRRLNKSKNIEPEIQQPGLTQIPPAVNL